MAVETPLVPLGVAGVGALSAILVAVIQRQRNKVDGDDEEGQDMATDSAVLALLQTAMDQLSKTVERLSDDLTEERERNGRLERQLHEVRGHADSCERRTAELERKVEERDRRISELERRLDAIQGRGGRR